MKTPNQLNLPDTAGIQTLEDAKSIIARLILAIRELHRYVYDDLYNAGIVTTSATGAGTAGKLAKWLDTNNLGDATNTDAQVANAVALAHAGGGEASNSANKALSNLANVAVNESLVPYSDFTLNLGSALKRWFNLHIVNVLINGAEVGRSGVGVVGIHTGTPPTSSPVNEVQVYVENTTHKAMDYMEYASNLAAQLAYVSTSDLLTAYSESTIKTQGLYSLKAIAYPYPPTWDGLVEFKNKATGGLSSIGWNDGTMNNVTVEDNVSPGDGKIVAGTITWADKPADDGFIVTRYKGVSNIPDGSPLDTNLTAMNVANTAWIVGGDCRGSFQNVQTEGASKGYGKVSDGESKNILINVAGSPAGLFKVYHGGGFSGTGNGTGAEVILIEFLDDHDGTILGTMSGTITPGNTSIVGILPAGTKYANFYATGTGNAVYMTWDAGGGHTPHGNVTPNNGYDYIGGNNQLKWGWNQSYPFQFYINSPSTYPTWTYTYDFGVEMVPDLMAMTSTGDVTPTLTWSDGNTKLTILVTFTAAGQEVSYIKLQYAPTVVDATLTHTLSPRINLTGKNNLYLDIRSSRTGSNIKVSIHDTGGTTTEITPAITSADTWQTVTWDISAVSDDNKKSIDKIIISIVNADAANTFYLDNFYQLAADLKFRDECEAITSLEDIKDAVSKRHSNAGDHSNALDHTQNTDTGTSSGSFFFNDEVTDGSWRLIISGNDLAVERLEGGSWVEKGSFLA